MPVLLRGDFKRLAPSDLTKPGAFGFEWVKTTGENYANAAQRTKVVAVQP
ncbi:hypothetical protein T484DRAFT_1833067 [Baffinella frigidus]|nr:hypothetical protein T484DRAFT_1833067 [Cryptophyta sp. CCMP2293]